MIAENVAENNQVNNNQGSREYVQPEKLMPKDVPAPTTDDWLYVKGNKIVDKYGQEVWITGVNWFGYNTGTNTFDGLWAADLNTSLAAIADRGFNLLRIPISSELILQWASGNPPKANFNEAINSYLVGMDSLQIFDYVVGQSRANGLKIMIDIHSAKTDPMGHMKPVWFEADITEQDYLDSLSWVAERYKDDDTIIAYDLKNEPHGKPNESPRAIWNDSKDPENWKYVAEKAANAVLSKNPNVLVLVEGIEIYPKNIKTNGDYSSTNSADYYINWWGGNLRGVKDYPINLGKYQNKLVYSSHDYGPAVYAQPWFEGAFTYESLYKDCWRDNWMFIYEDEIAPLLIGEWGGFMSEPNLTWMKYLRELIKKHKLHHTFWCFNANSGDTGGLVLDDFVTWDEEKYNFVKEVLWTKEGKFVGLDHEIPLGKNGIALPKK
jgi:aryl-phospho-beta-D-glucosidase BglC (GH1 family)